MTALTIFATNSATSTLTTANKIVTSIGGGNTNVNTQVGKATGYSELPAQGTTTAWSAAGSLITPDGRGWLWDDSTLGNGSASFVPGTWTATVKMLLNANNITANIYVNVYRRTSSGVYYPIVLMSLTGANITTTRTAFTLTGTTTTASTPFQPGDMLYYDNQLDITGNGTNSNTTICQNIISNSSTLGCNDNQIVTPGYTTITNVQKDAATRLRLSSPTQMHDALLLFRLARPINSVLKDAQMRFLTNKSRLKDAVMLMRTRKSQQKDATIRFRTSTFTHLALFPPAVRRTGQFPNATRRQSV